MSTHSRHVRKEAHIRAKLSILRAELKRSQASTLPPNPSPDLGTLCTAKNLQIKLEHQIEALEWVLNRRDKI